MSYSGADIMDKFKQLFQKVKNENKRNRELDYLRYLMESDFVELLAQKLKSLQGNIPSQITVKASYIDKSPILIPLKSWPTIISKDKKSGVEFGDILLTLKKLSFSNKRPSKRKGPGCSYRAFVFQAKNNNNPKGSSTDKQEYLYEKWPLFKVHSPKAIKKHCNQENSFYNTRPAKKKWYVGNKL